MNIFRKLRSPINLQRSGLTVQTMENSNEFTTVHTVFTPWLHRKDEDPAAAGEGEGGEQKTKAESHLPAFPSD